MDHPKNEVGPARRRFLGQGFGLMAASLCLPLLNLFSGCEKEVAQEKTAQTIPLAMLPEGSRTSIEVNGLPVELLRTANGVTARSLRCTHQGCKVKWHEDQQQYICPCHEGKFDASGQVVYGMPRRPLEVVAVRIEGESVIVGP